MPDEWQSTKLGALGDVSTSSVDKKTSPSESPVSLVNYMDVYRNNHLDSSLPLMQVTASESEIRRFQVSVGDVLFTPSSETPEDIGHAAVVTAALPRTLHSYHTVRLRPYPHTSLDLRFAGWFMTSSRIRAYFRRAATGSTRYTLSLDNFRNAPVDLPPLAEQRLIAEVLDTVDEAIRKTEEIIAKLKQVKQGLLHDLLTRGIDENGELRDPDRHPEQFKDSPLGRIPNAWRVLSLREVGDWTSGGTPSKANPAFWGGDIPWVSPKDMKVFRLRSTIDWVTGKGASSGTRTVPAGSVFIVVRGMILAHTFPVCISDQEMAFNQDVKGIVPCADVRGDFLGYWFVANSDAMLALVTEATHGTKRIDLGDLLRHPIGIPCLDEQDAILSRLSEASAKEAHEVAALEKFRLLKRGLMEDLLTGRVRVTALLGSSNSHEQPTTVSEAS